MSGAKKGGARFTGSGRKMSDREEDRDGRERLSAELPDVRHEERMWSDAALDELSGRHTGDPRGAETGVGAEPTMDELMRRSRLMPVGELWNLLRRNGGSL